MWRDDGEAMETILGPCQKDEVLQEAEVGVVTDTPLNRGYGWRSWSAARNGNCVCDGNLRTRG
jgi:hypothetical protein